MTAQRPDSAAAEAHLASGGLAGPKGQPAAEVRRGPAEEVEMRPRGAMVATLLYLLAVAAAWGYMYASLLRAGQGSAP